MADQHHAATLAQRGPGSRFVGGRRQRRKERQQGEKVEEPHEAILSPGAEAGDHERVLNLSRNLGLITGASVMGAVFAQAAGAVDVTTVPPDSVAAGMRLTFAVAAMLMIGALIVAIGARARAVRPSRPKE
jgi:hypothetical protein